MKVRDWQEILKDVTESSADPGGWRAVSGDRAGGLGEDLFLGHPSAGVFQIKTYAKNPLNTRGVGSRVARRIDEDLDPLFPEQGTGRFGVNSPVPEDDAEEVVRDLEEVLQAHADAPTDPGDLFEDVMETVDSPAYGPMEADRFGRPEPLEELTDTFEEAQQLLDAELEELIEEDDAKKGFH